MILEPIDLIRDYGVARTADVNNVLERTISETQILDIMPHIPTDVFEIISNNENIEALGVYNKEFTKGGYYISPDGTKRYTAGIRITLATYVIARLHAENLDRLTAFGTDRKKPEFSTETPREEVAYKVRSTRKIADAYMKQSIDMLKYFDVIKCSDAKYVASTRRYRVIK